MRLPFPTVDPMRHLDLAKLEARFAILAPSPRDEGRVTLLVARAPDRMRHLPPKVLLDHDGMPEDDWGRSEAREVACQLSAMEHRVAAAIANGQSLALFGDNLTLDLDLSLENLPPHSRLRVGGAVVEVTPKPHTGCSQYRQRFGGDALNWISAPERRALRLRGIHLKVIEPGEVGVGDAVTVLHRGA